MSVKALIDIHGYLRGRRRAVNGGRRKVDTCETSLSPPFHSVVLSGLIESYANPILHFLQQKWEGFSYLESNCFKIKIILYFK